MPFDAAAAAADALRSASATDLACIFASGEGRVPMRMICLRFGGHVLAGIVLVLVLVPAGEAQRKVEFRLRVLPVLLGVSVSVSVDDDEDLDILGSDVLANAFTFPISINISIFIISIARRMHTKNIVPYPNPCLMLVFRPHILIAIAMLYFQLFI